MSDKVLKKFSIHPTFFLLFLWFLINNNILSFLSFTFVVLCHELGHFWVSKKLGYKLNCFCITPHGVNLNYKEKNFENEDEIKIAAAGPIANFVLSILFLAIWWVCPVVYNFTYEIAMQSFLLGIFNLLPCYPLDGGRVFCGILSKQMQRKKAVKMTTILNYFFSSILFSLFVISCFYNFNPTFLLCGVFLLLSNLDMMQEGRYNPIYMFNKKIKNFSNPKFIFVNSKVSLSQLLKHIEIKKYTIFIVNFDDIKTRYIDENLVKKLSTKFALNTNLNEIFKTRQDKV